VTESMDLLLPAKINLFLKIVGKRSDGYHELITRMLMISCFDKLHLKLESGVFTDQEDSISFRVRGRVIDGDPNTNLIVRAARLVVGRYATKRLPRISIELEKHIPIGAGLGGGSSDAAGTLWGINRLLGSGLSFAALSDMASSLGSDVPFFLGTPHALGWGRGEKILPLPAERSKIVVLWNPGFSLSTAMVYRSLNVGVSEELTEAAAVSKIEGLLRQDVYMNDLESVAFTLHPELCSVKESFLEFGADKSLMSGSGPTVFGVFRDRASAEQAVKALQSQYGGWADVFETLERSPLS